MAALIAAILPVVWGLLETVRERSTEALSPVDPVDMAALCWTV
jgi:hypothetical protein